LGVGRDDIVSVSRPHVDNLAELRSICVVDYVHKRVRFDRFDVELYMEHAAVSNAGSMCRSRHVQRPGQHAHAVFGQRMD
ncbi:unnamed protein product, partial [Aphanomyces euteiches]